MGNGRTTGIRRVSDDFSGLGRDHGTTSGGAKLFAVLAYLVLFLVIAAPFFALLFLAADFFSGGGM